MRDKYRPGDRVVSRLSGYCLGSPGVILGETQIRYGVQRAYQIELDNGVRITLRADHIKPLEDNGDLEKHPVN